MMTGKPMHKERSSRKSNLWTRNESVSDYTITSQTCLVDKELQWRKMMESLRTITNEEAGTAASDPIWRCITFRIVPVNLCSFRIAKYSLTNITPNRRYIIDVISPDDRVHSDYQSHNYNPNRERTCSYVPGLEHVLRHRGKHKYACEKVGDGHKGVCWIHAVAPWSDQLRCLCAMIECITASEPACSIL